MKVNLKNDRMLSMQNLFQSFMNGAKESSPPIMVTPISDLGSNSVDRPSNLAQNLENVFTGPSRPSPLNPSDKPPVILLNKYNKELEIGHVVTEEGLGRGGNEARCCFVGCSFRWSSNFVRLHLQRLFGLARQFVKVCLV